MIPFYERHIQSIRGSTIGTLNFPLHLHTSPELVCLRSGSLKVQLHNSTYTMTPGDFLLILPNVIHSYETLSPSRDTQIDLFICGQDSMKTFPPAYSGAVITDPVRRLDRLHPDVEYVLNALLRDSADAQDKQLIQAYLQILWRRILPELTVTDTVQPSATDLTTSLITYITEHFCEQLSLESLSKQLGICRFYLSRIFTQVLHVGFYEYINTLRINYAKELLENTNLTILNIAMQCGFQSQQTFNRIFKSLCGITPTVYRNTHKHAGTSGSVPLCTKQLHPAQTAIQSTI